MSARCIALSGCFALIIGASTSSYALDETDGDETDGKDRKKVIEAWTQREQKISSAVFEIDMTTFKPKGSLNNRRGHDPKSGDSPPSDVRLQRHTKLYLSGKLARLEYVGEVFNITEGKPEHEDGVLVVQADGEVRELTKYNDNRALPLQGSIKLKAYQLAALTYKPIFFTCRGLAALPLDEYRFNRVSTEVIAGECIKLTSRSGARQIWIDPARDDSVIRYVTQSSGGRRQRTQLDIDYVSDTTVGWVPKRWKLTGYFDKTDSLAYQCDYEVVSYQLNSSLASDLFTLSFPAGAHVVDLRNPREEVRYRYLASGERRELSRKPVHVVRPATRCAR